MTTLDLMRLQFGLTAGFHFLFVALTLGLAPLLAFMQTRYVATGRDVHRSMTRFWGQLYVINYGIGIITGLVMEFQFGLNWNGLSAVAGNVFGAPLALETLIAFFLESTFLGMWIFGWDRMPKWVHLGLIYAVTATAFASAFFIMVANGFLQHPVGGVLQDGVFHLTDFGALLTNSEALDATVHLVAGTFLTGGVFVAGVSAWHLVHHTGRHDLFLRSLRIGLVVSPVAAALAIQRGFTQFGYLQTDQPGKLAQAFGMPDVVSAQAASPGGLLPPAWISVPATVMQDGAFVLAGLTLAALVLLAVFRGRLTGLRWLLRPLSWAVPLPFVLVLCGWLVREEGRQPWLVYGLLRTSDAASPVGMISVAASFVVFVGAFVALAAIDWALMRRFARRGPDLVGLPGVPTEVSEPDRELVGRSL